MSEAAPGRPAAGHCLFTTAARYCCAVVAALAAALAAATCGCAGKGLPERQSAAAQLYVQRCGNCHKPYDPRSMTAAMWKTKVVMMQPVIARAGLAPLSADEIRTILSYLERNAGRQ